MKVAVSGGECQIVHPNLSLRDSDCLPSITPVTARERAPGLHRGSLRVTDIRAPLGLGGSPRPDPSVRAGVSAPRLPGPIPGPSVRPNNAMIGVWRPDSVAPSPERPEALVTSPPANGSNQTGPGAITPPLRQSPSGSGRHARGAGHLLDQVRQHPAQGDRPRRAETGASQWSGGPGPAVKGGGPGPLPRPSP